MKHWLVKSEPYKYSFAQLQRDGRTAWDGVRNFEARNNLRAMARGDLLLFYHSNEGKEIVGVARVERTAYPDPTDDEGGDWSVVDVAPVCALSRPVSLATLKATPALAQMALLRRSRLSVVPVTPAEFREVLALAETRLPAARSAPRGKA
jgi:predicted RNA-binding protein with PUA-like domain